MLYWQKILLIIYLLFNSLGLLLAHKKVAKEKNNLGLTGIFVLTGSFVWADMIIFGLFWMLFTFLCLILDDFLLFLLSVSIFWVVRSLGETIYWFNQQFSPIKRNTYKDFFFSKYFGNDDYTVWFVMQIIMQCLTVVSIIFSIYFGKMWLDVTFSK